jgi:hypothetical protein
MFGIFKNNKSNNDITKHLITEPEILTLFTEDELAFLVHHNIDPEDVFDARGMTGKKFKVAAKTLGAEFVFTSPCQKAGHRLKTRSSGSCIQCNPAVIAYQMRNAVKAEGIVYIAHSKILSRVKVGCCWPNLNKRIQNLQSHAYGGARDWELAFDVKVNAMGLVEGKVHKRLATYAAEGKSYRGGQTASELFDCPVGTAIEAVKAEA